MSDGFRVEAFDSMEEMFAAMTAAEDAANDRLTPAQRELRDAVDEDVWFVRRVQMGPQDLVIFGRVLSRAHYELQQRQAYGADSDMDDDDRTEFEEVMASWDDSRSRGYLYGECFSEVLPHGEWGDTHVSEVVGVRPESFEEAHFHSWTVGPHSTELLADLERADREQS